MSKKRKHGHRRRAVGGGRATPKGTRPATGPGPGHPPFDQPGLWADDPEDIADPDLAPWDEDLGDPGDPEALIADIREAIDAPDPLDLLALASGILSALDPRTADPFDRPDPDAPTLADLVGPLAGDDRPETTALLAVFGTLTDDDVARRRIRRALTPERRARADLPAWLERLDDAAVARVVEQTHVLGDGDDILVELHLDTHVLTIITYVDHNLGTAVKDAFVIPAPAEVVIGAMRDAGADGEDISYRDLDPADARARLVQAGELTAMMVPRIETDTWPACRPLLEWALRLLPEGGHGYDRPDWSDEDTGALAAAFLASAEGAAHDDPHHRDLLDSILWFGTGYGPGDPLRWSPVAAEILLLDWVPRKIVADAAHLEPLPDLLRAFVRYCHRERQIPPHLTDETLAAVDELEPVYQQLIRSDRPQGPEALITAMGAASADPEWSFDDFSLTDPTAFLRRSLEERVGGAAALAALDDRPLPDEAFDWAGIDQDVHARVGEVLALLDRFADDHLGVEFRTATRRLLARIGRHGPDAFRRRGAASTAAAAIAWLVARDNDLLEPRNGGMYAKDLTASFGRSGSASSRAGALLRAAGLGDHHSWLAPPDLLTSRARAGIVEQRENLPLLDAVLRGQSLGSLGSPIGRRHDTSTAGRTSHVLKVTIDGTRPPVWRRLRVPSDLTLGGLHDVLQVAFGWHDAHLHSFEVDGERFEPDGGAGGWGRPDDDRSDEDEVVLAAVLAPGDRALYTYDFGDDWRHWITVEAVEPRTTGDDHPICTGGRRAGPPEDVGGPPGFAHFLRAVSDRAHPDHPDLCAWYGGTFRADAVDRDAVNLRLAGLRGSR